MQPNTLGALHAHLAQLHVLLCDPPAALGHAAQTIELATRHDLPLWLGLGRMYRGAALVAAGVEAGDGDQVDEGIAAGLEGMAAYRATGAGLDVPTCLCWYAAGHGKRGRPAAALSLLAQALELIAATGEAYFAAEAHRLVAEQKMRLDAHDPAAEASLLRSLAIAREQRAQLLARRAGAALAHKWRGQGRRARARALLATLHVPPIDAAAQRSSGQVPSR